MSLQVESETLTYWIRQYIKSDPSHKKDAAKAYRALAQPQRKHNIRENFIENNSLFPIIQALIEFSRDSDTYKWRPRPVIIGTHAVHDHQAATAKSEQIFDQVRPLYQIADTVISQDGMHIDSHNQEHIRRSLLQLDEMIQILETNIGIQLSPECLLEAKSTVVLHDVALGLTGRKIPHEQVGADLVPLILRVDPQSNLRIIPQILSDIAENIRLHITHQFDFWRVKNSQHSIAYALAVLADESDITRERINPQCFNLFLQGENDPWFYLNNFTHFTRWSWDITEKCPVLTLNTFIGDPESEILHSDFILRSTGRKPQDKQKSMENHFIKTAIDLVMNGRKLHLFEGALKSIYGTKKYILRFCDIKGTVFSENYFGIS